MAYSPGSVKAVYPKKWDVMDHEGPMHFEATVVETTSPVNPGDSGGPLVNSFGELVAVTQGGISSMGTISYFIDLSEVRKVLKAKNIRITTPPAAAVAATDGEPKGEDPGAGRPPAPSKTRRKPSSTPPNSSATPPAAIGRSSKT